MNRIRETSFEAWVQEFKDLNESNFKKIQGEIPELSHEANNLAWEYIISLLHGKLFDRHALPDLTPLESFRLHFPNIDVPV